MRKRVANSIDYARALAHNGLMNKLTAAKRTAVVAALVEGNSVRSTARMTNVSQPLPPRHCGRYTYTVGMFSWNRPPKAAPLTLKVSVVIEPDGNRFHAYCPGLQGIHVDGASEEEALEHAKHAVLLYLESLARHGDPLPVGPHCELHHEEEPFQIPMGAFLRHLELKWPSPQTSGIS